MGNDDGRVQLDPAAELAIDSRVREMVGRWLKWLGIGNAAVVLTALVYIFTALPGDVSERLAATRGRMATLLEESYAESFALSGAAEERMKALSAQADAVESQLERVQADVTLIRSADTGRAANLLSSIRQSGGATDLILRVGDLERRFATSRFWQATGEHIELGFLPEGNTDAATFAVPPEIPNDAREILVFVWFFSGSNGPSKGGTFSFFTQDGERRYQKLMHWYQYRQDAVGFNSDNLWFPLTAERKLHVRSNSIVKEDNAEGRAFIIGYR